MSKMKVNDFINKAKEINNMSTKYKLGTYCQKSENGKLLTDCSGLIKGILWGYPAVKYASNNVQDINANTIIKKCTSVTTDFTKAKKGWLVWMDGHIGIYIGNGQVIESSPRWKNGVQKTFCRGSGYRNNEGLNERTWTKCGKFDIYIDYTQSVQQSKPSVSSSNTNTSGSIVDYLKSKGIDSSYSNRKKLAAQYNISNYQGTAAQNTKLLNLMKAGVKVKTQYYKRYVGKSGSIAEALKAVGVDGSYAYRKKIAQKNGIANYRGTAAQNTRMLNLLKQGSLIKV